MKRYWNTLLVGLAIFFAGIFYNNVSADTPEIDGKELTPDFQNVDVVIKYEHNGDEYLENVDVYDKTKSEKPYIVITLKELGRSEIRILEDLRVYTVIDG